MTRLTAMFIAKDPDVYASSYESNGKFGIYIGTYDESPSGCKRPRDLLTSEPIYDTAELAQAAADKTLSDCRELIRKAEAGEA